MIGQYIYYSISYPSFHTYTYINKFRDDIIFFYIRKIQDTDDWTLVAVLLMGIFEHQFDKTRNMLLYINTSRLTKVTCAKPVMGKDAMKGSLIEGAERSYRRSSHLFSFQQSGNEKSNPALSFKPKYQPCAWLVDILTDVSGSK